MTPKLSGHVYSKKAGGHRRSYVNTLANVTGLTALIGEDKKPGPLKLALTKHLLLAGLEDGIFRNLFILMIRSLLLKRTTVIAMNPGRIINGGLFQHKLQGIVMRFLHWLPTVKTLSILPFYLNPKFKAFTNNWIYDPQFWDLDLNEVNKISTPLSEDILEQAKGREILLFLGHKSYIKGFDRLVEIMEADKDIISRFCIVAAGSIEKSTLKMPERFSKAGGVAIDRYLSEDEVLSLKTTSSVVWALYDPYYNSSSGMFGRAMQLGKKTIVRKGTYIEQMANELGYPVFSVDFHDTDQILAALRNIATTPMLSDYSATISELKVLSISRIQKYVTLK